MNKRMQIAEHRARARRRERNMGILTACCAALFVFALIGVIILLNDNSAKNRGSEWIIVGGKVEVAAPPINNVSDISSGSSSENASGGAIRIATKKPVIPTILPTVAPTAPVPVPPVGYTPEPTEAPTIAPTAEPTREADATVEPDAKIKYLTITAGGDCTLGGDYNTDAHERFDGYYDQYGSEYFLENLKEIFENDDITFVNLEGPLTDNDKKRGGRIFNFKGKAEYAKILSSASVEVAGLANNHSLDFMTKGLKDTAVALNEEGIGACGYQNAWTGDVNGVSVCLMSVTEWDYTIDELTEMVRQNTAGCDLLVVMIHWGEEKLYTATYSQKEYGRALVDAGADLVLGSHSHVVGGVEEYNGKYIVYGLGNLCFGGNTSPFDTDCILFQQTFRIQSGSAVNAGIAIIPCSISTNAVENNYQPAPLTGEDAARVLKKVSANSNFGMDDVLWADGMRDLLASIQ